MPKYDIKVVVEYNYSIDADSYEEAEQEGWNRENYSHFAEVVSIDVTEDESEYIEEDDEEVPPEWEEAVAVSKAMKEASHAIS